MTNLQLNACLWENDMDKKPYPNAFMSITGRLAVRIARFDRKRQKEREEQLVRVPSKLMHVIHEDLEFSRPTKPVISENEIADNC